jgi:hypothetical protein
MSENVLTVNDDIGTIKVAYQDALKKLFAVLFDGTVTALGDQAKITQAEQRFTAGLTLARHTRDRALALVAIPPAAP